ncbi:MAG TPA: riboflavin synthase [Candidatus Acidoferrales bacterium]|nr:riboflavin synthase [Candidatus Acidoferrales bacterium]
MFTGIIEHLGRIESLKHTDAGGRLRIGLGGASSITSDLKIGSSIAVNGCCLTVVEAGSDFFCADLSAETLQRTSFAETKAEDMVNLELPLSAGARLGGHFVQGHVDGVGHVKGMVERGESWWLSVNIPAELQRYVAEKGSLAVDGISLTVARWHGGIAEFAIIPHTHANANLRGTRTGGAVNIECDILAKYVESLLKRDRSAVAGRWTIEQLVEEGF